MNKLINETSPYLLQHAHNPVDWYPWGEEALRLAGRLDKPILVSIGYSACHWCHVMEKESFEDAQTAALMNECFVNIKIDREERPDLDHIYMDAVQTMTGSGGWPLNVFLTPAGKPFYGGTYYPPRRSFNRASWKEVLQAVYDAYQNKKQDVLAQAENLTQHLAKANGFGISSPGNNAQNTLFTSENITAIAANILQQADTEWGGFGMAPKFPQTFTIQVLLQHFYYTGHEAALKQALLSIDKMMQGGIYDHLGGGFARYSTDTEWLAPHFEKMLYDNALLLQVVCAAYQLTGLEKYAAVIRQTMGFIEREMLLPGQGFYSALDADSEGVEGKYYVWQKKEVEALLGSDAGLFCAVYGITDHGNWEHTNIIWLRQPVKDRLAALGVEEAAGEATLQSCRNRLFAERAKRVRPALDDKMLTGWNALMISACCKAYAVLKDAKYLALAQNGMRFLEEACGGGDWKHTYKNGVAKYPAFLDDYAYVIDAYIRLQEATGNAAHLEKAKELTDKVIKDFSDDESLFFWFTPAGQQDVIVRKKEVYDGATPSGNAVMAHNLYYLSVVFNVPAWRERAINMVVSVGQSVVKYPVSFGCWALLLQNITMGYSEVTVVGADWQGVLGQINGRYLPGLVLQAATHGTQQYALLRGKNGGTGQTLIYLCKNYQCNQPVHTVAELLQQFEKSS